MNKFLLSFILFPFLSASASPEFKSLRQDEDPESLKKAAHHEWWKAIKHRPIGNGHFSIGGEIRLYGEYFGNPDFGNESSDSYLLQRYVAHLDYRPADHYRFFAQLYRAEISGREGIPNSVERNRLTSQQLFVDLSASSVRLRLGRQELRFGSQRLVGVREGPNVRRAFNGVRLSSTSSKNWSLDLFYMKPIFAKVGTFDDDWWPNDQSFWGIYSTGPIKSLPGKVDIYYLGFENDSARFNEGTEDEQRHTLGIRWFGRADSIDWNAETIFQWGSFGEGSIEAWSLSSEIGYTFQGSAWQPRLSARADIASGDRSQGDGDLETFNPLFPRGNYFGESAAVGPSNFADLYFGIELHPNDVTTLYLSWDFFFRHRSSDGVYAPPARLIRRASDGSGKFVGHELSFTYARALNAFFSLEMALSQFFIGDFIKNNPSAEDLQYAALWLTFKF